MLDTREEQYEALVGTREFLSDKKNWIKGKSRSQDNKRFCVMAYMSHAYLNGDDLDAVSKGEAGWPCARSFCNYLNSTVRKPFSDVPQFQDSRYVSHKEVLAWLDGRIAELAPVKTEELEYV